MGESEAVYHLNRDFKFRDSDTKCIFVQTCKRSERSKMLKNVTNKPEFNCFKKMTVENHICGEYIEQYDVNSKYERRDIDGHPELDDHFFSHMSKMYSAFWGNKSSKEESEKDDDADLEDDNVENEFEELVPNECEDVTEFSTLIAEYNIDEKDIENIPEEVSDEKFKFVMKYPLDVGKGQPLPKIFRLRDVFPGEPPFMKLRTRPAVLRFHKYNAEKNPDNYWYAEALLYLPHRDEDDLQRQINEAKENIEGAWENFVTRISHVKSQVMEYIDENEEARSKAAEIFLWCHFHGIHSLYFLVVSLLKMFLDASASQ